MVARKPLVLVNGAPRQLPEGDQADIGVDMATQAELDAGIASREPANANIQSHIASTTNPHGVTKAQVGLGNVDNTSDATKPVSAATQVALDLKVDKITGKGLSTEDYTSAEKTKLSGIAAGAQVNTVTSVAAKTGSVTLDKADVGLANVDNTSDLDKPISTATQTLLDGKIGSTTSKLELAAVDQTVFASTTLVDACIYDTSRDSDGGAWRKRCQHTSWYNETIYGKWLGSASSEANARAIEGATTNDYYFDTTAAKFYALNAGSGRTEVFRGNTREFPARVLITAESYRVVIWDMTQPGCPMWRSFPCPVSSGVYMWGGGAVTAIAAANGTMLVGGAARAARLNFIADVAGQHHSGVAGRLRWAQGLASWYSTNVYFLDASYGQIVNITINDVALTVLPSSVSDPLSGMAVPTIAAATDGNDTYSVSIIKHDGSVVNIGPDSSTRKMVGVRFVGSTLYAVRDDGTAYVWNDVTNIATGTAPDATYSATSVPALLGTASGLSARAFGSTAGLTRLKDDPSTPAKGMVAYSTIAYASGWLPGDIRGAWITEADGVSETLIESTVFEDDFSSYVDDAALNDVWTKQQGDLTLSSGSALLTNTGAASTYAYRSFSTIVGRTYNVSAFMAPGVSSPHPRIGISNNINSATLLNLQAATSGTYRGSFVATASTTVVNILMNNMTVGATSSFDNISVREVIADRSVKNNGLVINGSLTKAPVAAGAGLCALSGFSAANYMEQAFSANHDYGVAAFAFLVPLKEAPNTADEVVFERAYYTGGAYSGARIRLEVLAAGTLKATFSDGTNTVTLTSTAAVDDSVWRTGLIVGFDGTNFRMVAGGGQDLATAVARGSVGSLNNANAVLRVGLGVDGNAPLTNGTVVQLRATAMWPSADQIRHVFETEKKLFEPGAQCTIAGTSNAVMALAYDEDTDLLHVGTSWGRSAFQGLLRVSSEATPVGSIKAIAASGGAVAQAGATAADIYIPAYSLREELERLDDAAKALGSVPVFHEFDATTAQTDFLVPKGFRVVAVYSAGALKRVGSTKDYTVANNGFQQTVNFAVAPGDGAWVSIMTVRDGK